LATKKPFIKTINKIVATTAKVTLRVFFVFKKYTTDTRNGDQRIISGLVNMDKPNRMQPAIR
jgi:hypothetical protein